MALGWSEVRARAAVFAADWSGVTQERAEAQTFWNEFFALFGIRRRTVAVYEHLARRTSTGRRGFIDVLWPGMILAEHKSADDRDLGQVIDDQALDYVPSLPIGEHPRLIVASDFARIRVRDLDRPEDADVEFPLSELTSKIELFAVLAQRTRRRQAANEEEVNLAATALLAGLHDALRDSGYAGHPLRVLMVRLLFVLFADDTAIWEHDLFHYLIADRTRPDGTDTGQVLAQLWQVLDEGADKRSSHLDEEYREFTYINGGLFAETIPIASFDATMRDALLACCAFDWSAISPVIFGSLFQEVMTPVERRQLGAHYTTEANILKVCESLFLADLRADLDAATTLPALRRFRDRLPTLRWLDPACGCGNFLMVAYRELRVLETDCLRRIRDQQHARGRRSAEQLVVDVRLESQVGVGQFYGIEVEEFPARIAETAMYLIDHLANQALTAEFGSYYTRFPIAETPHITVGNALRTPWDQVLPAADCSYLFGNPPFLGHATMTTGQQQDKAHVFATTAPPAVARWGRLDYVACWYARALAYLRGTENRAAFVSTNSITQGEQARSLGPAVLRAGYAIDFAHTTFAWSSEARGSAHVSVVIIGFSAASRRRTPTLFTYQTVRSKPVLIAAKQINWYLADGPNLFPDKRYTPLLPGWPDSTKGSQPTDGGHLLVTTGEVDQVRADPVATRYLRPYMQTTELLYEEPRWCLWLVDASPEDLRTNPLLRDRLRQVAASRRASKTASVQALAATPALFTQRRQPTVRYFALPEVSSEHRRVIPGTFLEPDVIAGNKLITFPGADLWHFGLLQSAHFVSWVGVVSGRLESRFSISPSLSYFTFPFPERTARREQRVTAAAQQVLDIRRAHADSNLATLYDPLAMPADLTAAHDELDRAVNSCYGTAKQSTDSGRLSVLFRRYAQLTGNQTLFDSE